MNRTLEEQARTAAKMHEQIAIALQRGALDELQQSNVRDLCGQCIEMDLRIWAAFPRMAEAEARCDRG